MAAGHRTTISGQVTLTITARAGLSSGQGIVCYMNFQAVGNVGEVAPLTFNSAKINGSPVQTTSGSVAIICPAVCSPAELEAARDEGQIEERAKWDADGDGKIGLAEAIRALQIVSGLK